MKRILAFISALSLLISCLPAMVSATAETETVANVNLIEVKAEPKELFPDLRPKKQQFLSPNMPLEDELTDAFMDYIKEHFGNCETQFSIADFNIPYSRFDDLRLVIWYEIPELFHVYRLGCNYNSSTNTISDITATYQPYADTAAEYKTCWDKMLSSAEYLLQGVKDNKNLTDVEKALLLHDRLAIWTEYDLEGADSMDPDSPIFGAYSALGEGLSVCQGYSMAYMYLLEQVGIESDLCTSDQLCHAWNIVYIDGVAYHVDVTWDDPVNSASATYNDDYGRVLHDNFLLSSNGIWSTEHKAYDYNTAPNDTRYDSKSAETWWRNSETAIQVIGDKLYYQNSISGDVVDPDGGEQIHTHEHDYSSYTLSSADGMLLCATAEDVHTVDPMTGESSVVYIPKTGSIQGMKYENGKIYIQLTDDYGNSWRESVDYVAPEVPEASVDYTYTVENGEATITGYTGAGGDIVLPSELEGYPVTAIADYAFRKIETLTSVVIPDSVVNLGEGTFGNCANLAAVTLPANLEILTNSVFEDCSALSTVIIPETVTTIAPRAFWYSGLTEIIIPASVTNIQLAVFGGCVKLKSIVVAANNPNYSSDDHGVLFNKDKTTLLCAPAAKTGTYTIPATVTTIEQAAFEYTQLQTVTIPNGVKTIGRDAFNGCDELTAVVIPDSVTTLYYKAFSNNHKLTSLTIGNGVKELPTAVFYGNTALTSVVIPNGVEIIGEAAFAGCTALKQITIPASVTQIGVAAFLMPALTDVYYNGTQEQWNILTTTGVSEENGSLLQANIIFNGDHVHSYTKKVTKPTCTAKGYTTFTCTCGDTYKANYTNALGHSYKSGVCTRCKNKPAGAKITTQPVNVAVSSGKTAKVSIKATGTGLKYQWYYAKKGARTYTKASTTNSYSVKMSTSYNGTKAYCVVTDQYGNSVKSNVVTLYKGTPAKITTQPKSITVANGKTGKLELKASGSSLKYQWYVKYKGASSFTKVGSSSKSYSFKMASKYSGAQAYCVVKDKYGIEVKSSVVTIKMPVQPKITTQPKSVTQVSGKTVKFSVKASGDGLKYQWYYAKKGSSSFKKLSGKTSATYSVKVSSSANGRKYYCLVTDKYGQTVKSSAVTLTMKTVAKITTQPKSVTVANGKTAKVTIKAVGDGLKYTWYYLQPGATKYVKATSTGASYSVKMAAAWKNAKVYCVIADKYGNSVKSSVVTLKMK